MAGEPTLYARMELRLNEAEKRLAKFQSNLDKSMGGMERRTQKAATGMQASLAASAAKIGVILGSVGLSGALAFAGIMAAANRTKAALDDFGKIADQSLASGLDPEVFQALAYQASLFGVEIDSVSSALATFAKNSGLAVVGKGKMVKALQALNPALLENIRNAKDQETRIRLAADAIDQAKTASEKAALATSLFGDAGTKLVGVFDGGSAAMDRQAAAAQQLGIIVDRDLIARSDELGDQMDTVSKIIDVQLKQAFVNLGPAMIYVAELAATVATGIGSIVDRWQDLENMTGRGLDMKLKSLSIEDLDLEKKILEKQAEARDVSPLASSLGFGADSAVVQNEIADLVAQRGENAKQQAEIMKIISDRDEAAAKLFKRTHTGGTDGEDLPPLPPPGGTSRNKAAEDAIRQAEAVKKLIDDLEVERAQVGMTEVEIAKMNAIRQAGAAATDEQKAKIIELIEATASEKAAVDQVKASMDFAKDAANGFLSDLRSGLEDGKLTWQDFGNAALNVLNKIIDKIQGQLVDALFDLGSTNSGGLGGILGALFGGVASAGAGGGVPKFANGTNYAPGGLALVGERGPELVNLPRGSQVIPNGKINRALARGGGGSMSLSSTMNITVSGTGDKELIANLSAAGRAAMKHEIERFSKSALPKRVSEIARDPRKVR